MNVWLSESEIWLILCINWVILSFNSLSENFLIQAVSLIGRKLSSYIDLMHLMILSLQAPTVPVPSLIFPLIEANCSNPDCMLRGLGQFTHWKLTCCLFTDIVFDIAISRKYTKFVYTASRSSLKIRTTCSLLDPLSITPKATKTASRSRTKNVLKSFRVLGSKKTN